MDLNTVKLNERNLEQRPLITKSVEFKLIKSERTKNRIEVCSIECKPNQIYIHVTYMLYDVMCAIIHHLCTINSILHFT